MRIPDIDGGEPGYPFTLSSYGGSIKLSVNGKFVNGISKSTKKEGFICLESEGAEIHFRNIRIIQLP